MEKINLIFLHGFLGQPQDWDDTIDFLSPQESLTMSIHCLDLFNDEKLNPTFSFYDWGLQFREWLEGISDKKTKNIVIGYSMGGRLALYGLEASGNLIDQIIVVSANTGFRDGYSELVTSSQERVDRWFNDTKWADLFLKAPWEEVLRNWNAQSVFGISANEPQRQEKNYSRHKLSLALTNWSLAQQKDMRPVLKDHLEKVQWLVGENDEKYVEIAQNLEDDIEGFSFLIIPGTSHRILFEKPQYLAEVIDRAIKLQMD